jgi:hypothetical protein
MPFAVHNSVVFDGLALGGDDDERDGGCGSSAGEKTSVF